MIKKRIMYAAEKGFALSNRDVRNIMTQIASDGRLGFRTECGSPSQDTIRHWRAVNTDITYRKSENKGVAKLAAENFTHVSKFSDALKKVKNSHQSIFRDPTRLLAAERGLRA